MRHAALLVTSAAMAVLLLVACRDELAAPDLRTPVPTTQMAAQEQTTANQDFFFLPPMAPDPHGVAGFDEGKFDGSLQPRVEVCALTGAECATAQPAGFPIVFTMDGAGPARLRVDLSNESYHVNWQTRQPRVSSAVNYRIHVKVAGTVLGQVDVDVIDSGAEKKATESARFVAVVNGSTLPIKFRIERGAVFVVGTAGGTVSAQEGRVTLTIPVRAGPDRRNGRSID
ncbi:MAG: hypothetical protein IPP90_23480 [Gemmatimonadaceae bacterium]|nr:hypothetical protein [Gemmatimonadaceae bacterium]